jgi:hypothetical protein
VAAEMGPFILTVTNRHYPKQTWTKPSLLIIPALLDTLKVEGNFTELGRIAIYKTGFKSIILTNSGITNISGEAALADENVVIPESVTSIEGYRLFLVEGHCIRLDVGPFHDRKMRK